MRLSPKLVQRRIEIHIADFFEWLSGYYAEREWTFGPWQAASDGQRWDSRDVKIRVAGRDRDGRVRELRIEWENIPSVVDRQKTEPEISWSHVFVLALPPDYPSDLQMRIINLSPTMHPRMLPPDKEAPACIFPNAELDRVLREVLFNLLFKPDFVRPPILFTGADHGFRPQEMKWYSEYGPQRLFEELMAHWHARQTTLAADTPKPAAPAPTAPSPPPPAAPAAPFTIRGSSPPTPSEPESPPVPPAERPESPASAEASSSAKPKFRIKK